MNLVFAVQAMQCSLHIPVHPDLEEENRKVLNQRMCTNVRDNGGPRVTK